MEVFLRWGMYLSAADFFPCCYWCCVYDQQPRENKQFLQTTLTGTSCNPKGRKKASFLEILMLVLVNHIIRVLDRKFLVILERERLIAFCCDASAQNTSWSLPKPHLNTSKSKRTSGCSQDLSPHRLSHHVRAGSARLSVPKSYERSQLQDWRCYDEFHSQTSNEAENEERKNANSEAWDQESHCWQAGLAKVQSAKISSGIVEERQKAFKSIVFELFKEKFSTTVRKPEDWFDENSIKLEELINNSNLARNNTLGRNTKSAKSRYRTRCQLRQKFRKLKNK